MSPGSRHSQVPVRESNATLVPRLERHGPSPADQNHAPARRWPCPGGSHYPSQDETTQDAPADSVVRAPKRHDRGSGSEGRSDSNWLGTEAQTRSRPAQLADRKVFAAMLSKPTPKAGLKPSIQPLRASTASAFARRDSTSARGICHKRLPGMTRLAARRTRRTSSNVARAMGRSELAAS